MRIVQDDSDEKLAVVDASGGRRRPGHLSRGTSEQLYLCVRLGLASEVGNRAEPLPLVMDDVLVNFDSSRARAMAIELRAFAERHQVLIFTCHSFTRDLFRSLDASVRIEELAPRGLVAT